MTAVLCSFDAGCAISAPLRRQNEPQQQDQQTCAIWCLSLKPLNRTGTTGYMQQFSKLRTFAADAVAVLEGGASRARHCCLLGAAVEKGSSSSSSKSKSVRQYMRDTF
jgi:hypothetical protein